MDKNGARGRAHSIVASILRNTAKTSIIDVALGVTDLTPGNLAMVKQEIQHIADEHARRAILHKAIEVSNLTEGETWNDATITLPDEQKTTKPGKAFGDTGLGYWIHAADGDDYAAYVPTHLPSGYGVGAYFYSEEQCQRCIRALASCMNWNQSREALTADPSYQPEQFRAINQHFQEEDAAATAGGGQW